MDKGVWCATVRKSQKLHMTEHTRCQALENTDNKNIIYTKKNFLFCLYCNNALL